MSHETSSRSEPRPLQLPVWSSLLGRIGSEVTTARLPADRSVATAKQTAASAAARAHSRSLIALDGDPRRGPEQVSELIESAVDVIVGIAELAEVAAGSQTDHRTGLVDQTRRRLDAHEDGVLAGEITYRIGSEEGGEPVAHIRRALARYDETQPMSDGELRSLRMAAADLASLLVRAAANAVTGGRADGAPGEPPDSLDATLRSIIRELVVGTRDAERPIHLAGDVVAHHLAAGLRVRVPEGTFHGLSRTSPRLRTDSALLGRGRDAWVRLATCEYVAIKALDDRMSTPTYTVHFGGLEAAIVEGAVNVICGARLLGRPSAFRHRRAWGHQTVGLTYALEAYVAGLRGRAPSFEQAQLITVTRLVRAVAAIALLDMRGMGPQAGSGSSER